MQHTTAMSNPLQRRITLIRHAKAEDDGVTQDHARHLNARGRDDAAALGAWLKETKRLPEQFICSTATRTRETLAQFGVNVPTLLHDKAYLASAEELLALLQQTDDAVRHVGLIAHNPGLHQLGVTLAGGFAHEADAEKLMLKFPTSAYVSLVVDIAHWAQLAPHAATLEQLRFK